MDEGQMQGGPKTGGGALIILSLAGLALIVMVARTGRSPDVASPSLPIPTTPTIALPETRASSGLAWSRRTHPAQYADENRVTVEMTGRDDRPHERFMDVAGRAYSREFIAGFSYERSARVRISYLRRAETFIGEIRAEGLKPNFAYQLKLRGDPTDPEPFERIGYLGRWLLPGEGTNFTDDWYRGFPEKERAQSYLFFDYVVTDGDGNARREFYADSSLHVLWNATWQRELLPTDTIPRAVVPGVRPGLYTNPDVAPSPQAICAESEEDVQAVGSRPPIGSAFLPIGSYRGELVLTEESFHDFGDGGYWATVMTAPVAFEVVEAPRPSLRWTATEEVTGLSLSEAVTRGIEDASVDATRLDGLAPGDDPQIEFAEEIDLPADGRYLLSVEILCARDHRWEVFVDSGAGFSEDERRGITSATGGGWRRYELELTGLLAGGRRRIRLDPAMAPGRIGVRNPMICRVTSAGDS